uniref:Uncharacterized protein n=1 Tax=Anguilla anguilla TaxID=7936 RepID=A0A0E9UKV6_ANGAN
MRQGTWTVFTVGI